MTRDCLHAGVMKIHQLAAALQVLREAITGSIPRGTAAVLLSIMAACCALLADLCVQLRTSEDPRIAAGHARLVEELARLAQREQLHVIIRCESTGAHLLEDVVLASLRTWRSDPSSQQDLSHAARLITGRAHYQDTADFAASWLGINYHHAAARLGDAHLVIVRRHSDGREITPRHAALAELFAHPGEIEPRRILGAARALEKFEPKDTAHDGLPLPATATHADGALLETRIVDALQEPNRTTSEKMRGRVDRRLPPAARTGQAHSHRPVLPRKTRHRRVLGAAGRGGAGRNGAFNVQPGRQSAYRGWQGRTRQQLTLQRRRPVLQRPARAGLGRDSDEGSTKESSEQKEDHGLAGDGQVAPAQRRLNAFLAALAHTTSGGTDAEPSKTITPQVAVHLKLDSLKDLQDPNKLAAVTAHGVKLDAAVTGKLICQGEICRVLIGADGQPLDLGRSQRFFSEAIKKAAFARDRGCIVPGCTAPPEMIEYHYDDWWSRGGSTSCSNASCLCRRHHLAIHAGLLTLVKINGLAHILFPKHLDPSQTPGRNQLHAAA